MKKNGTGFAETLSVPYDGTQGDSDCTFAYPS